MISYIQDYVINPASSLYSLLFSASKTPEMTDETVKDIQVIWTSIEAAAATWRGEQKVCIPGMPEDRKEFWGAFAGRGKPCTLPVVEEFVWLSSGEGKVALDLGCGNSQATVSLLRNGWKVIAIDNSKTALAVLEKTVREENPAWLNPARLELVQEDVSTYTPREPADLVVASDLLPYIDPIKFRATWMKIHDAFVKKDGVFIGNLFRNINHRIVDVMRDQLGAWFLPDWRMVQPLLEKTGYTVDICQFRQSSPPDHDPIAIQFVARKS